MTTQQEERIVTAVCPECGAERPQQPHAADCMYADSTIISTTGDPFADSAMTAEVTATDADFGNDDDDESGDGEELSTEASGTPDPGSGWILKIEPVHTCIKPSIDNRTFVGSIWRCGGCNQSYLVYERRGKNAGTKAFRRISPEQAEDRLAQVRGSPFGMTQEPACLSEAELLVRMRAVRHPGPVVCVGPAYPIDTFAHYNNPYPGYFYGARVEVSGWLTDRVWVQENVPLKE